MRGHRASPGLPAHLGSRGAGSARRAQQVRQVPRVPTGHAAWRLAAAAKRWSGAERRSLEHRAGGVARRRAVEADFLGGLSGATMAFGKSLRDPYATSVGHLVGKEARGATSRLALGTVGALPARLHSRLLRGRVGPSWRKCYPPPQLSHATCVPPEAAVHLSFLALLYQKKKKIHNLPLDVSWESRAKQVTRGTEWSVGTAGRRKWKLLDPGKVLHKVHSLPSLYCYTHFTDQEEKAQRSKLA